MPQAYHQLQSKHFTKLLVNFAKCKCPLHFTSTNIQETYTVILVRLWNFQDSAGSKGKQARFLDIINITSVLKNGYIFATDMDKKIYVTIDPDAFEKTKIFDIFSCNVVPQCNGKKTNVLSRSKK